MAYVTGGKRLKAFLKRARDAQGSQPEIDVGFFSDARYPPVSTGKNGGRAQDPHLVATVAAWNEFGTRDGVPERPFMRNAVRETESRLGRIAAQGIDSMNPTITDKVANELGAAMADGIQRSIVSLRQPPNSPFTIRMKGSSNPLIDTGTMLRAVTWRVG